jgi:hypothetical protein
MPRGILIIIIVTVSVLDIASQRLRKLVLAGKPLGTGLRLRTPAAHRTVPAQSAA